jgi:hypothetical protein
MRTEGARVHARIIIRDFKRHVILSAWKYLSQCSSAEEAELLACREGLLLLLAHHWCHGPLILESDCSNCIVGLADDNINRSVHANLVEDINNIITMLGNVRLVKINRKQNMAAHELAQHARRVFSSTACLVGIPDCIQHVVTSDCNQT